jgi:hypothetical protein
LVETLGVGDLRDRPRELAGDYGEAPPGDDHLVLGHESLGRVVAAPDRSGFTRAAHRRAGRPGGRDRAPAGSGAAAALRRVHTTLGSRGVRLVLVEVPDPVRGELERYGITELVGAQNYLPALVDVLCQEETDSPGGSGSCRSDAPVSDEGGGRPNPDPAADDHPTLAPAPPRRR